MRFIYPNFLWALWFVAVPIIIHLVNLRRHRTVYFSNVELLKKVKKTTQRKSKIKQLLILACRILLIIALVTAFAKPYIPTGSGEKQLANNVVGIFIDNSFSMNAEGIEGKAIESAKQKAFAIVNGNKPDTKFALLTNELDEQQNRFYSKSEMMRLIADVKISHNWAQLSNILLRFNSMTENLLFKTNQSFYLISDFQKYTTDFANLQADTISTYNFIPVPVNNISNLYIDTCWFDEPTHHINQIEILNVRIVNNSQEEYRQIPVNLYLNDSLKALASINITAGEQKVITLEYSNLNKGLQLGRIEISDYPIVYDNNLYFTYKVKSSINALLIEQTGNKTSNNIKSLFRADDFIILDFEKADRLQISSLENYSTIFINELKTISSGLTEELIKYVNNGGTLVIIPGIDCNIENYNLLLSQFNSSLFSSIDTIDIPLDKIDYQNQLYKEVFKDNDQNVELPTIKYRYRFTSNQQIAESNILTFADKSKALSLQKFGEGKIFTFAFPLSENNNHFVKHILFLPTFFNIVLQSSFTQQLYYVIGKTPSFEMKVTQRKQSNNFMLKHLQSGKELIPNIIHQKGNVFKLATNNDFDAGFYYIYSGDETDNGIAFNYLLEESDFSYFTNNEIIELANKAGIKHLNLVEANNQKLTEAIEEIDNGKQLWKMLIFIGLFFIIVEAAIIRFWP